MLLWQPLPPRADHDEAIRRWASIEGKSATMRDDLLRAEFPKPLHDQSPRTQLALVSEFVIAVVEVLDVWLHARSR